MMRNRTTAPSFSKGELVRPVTGGRVAWRRLTDTERQAWYDQHAEDCRAGRDTWHDSAGEPRLAPNDTYFDLRTDMTLTVLRARVSAPAGYGRVKDCCEVFCPNNGETLYVSRHALTNRW